MKNKVTDKSAAKERILITVLFFTFILTFVGVGTLSFSKRQAETANIITAGDIEVKLLNQTKDGSKMAPLITSIMPGSTLDNVVRVQNVSHFDEYIRIKLTHTIYDSDKDKTELDASKAKFLLNQKDWTYRDGFYYYNDILQAGKITECLYNGIYLDTSIGNQYKTATIDVSITVEAVQTLNNGSNMFDAEGWEVVYE